MSKPITELAESGLHRSDIDGLRALAVVAVILNHIDKTLLSNGHLGVDIFYVISGFVITQSLVSRRSRSFGEFIIGFYTRRIKRLLPALLLCVAITCLVTLFVISPQSNLSLVSFRTGAASLFGLSNLYLLRQATDYFGASAELNPFTHTWSLGVEEQFYFVFPFLVWHSGLAGRAEGGIRRFSLIVVVAGLASLVSFLWVSNSRPITAFYLMPTRFWELAAGALAYLAVARSRTITDAYPGTAQVVTVLALLLLCAVLGLPQIHHHQEGATLAVVALTAILLLGVVPASVAHRLLTLRPMVFVGIISYSLYLWHWSVLTICRWTIRSDLWTVLLESGGIFLLAFLSHRLVERPLRYSGWKVLKIGGKRVGAIGHGLVSSGGLAMAIMLLAIPVYKKGILYTGTPAPLAKKGVNTLQDRQEYKGSFWTARECVLSSNDEVGKVIIPENCTLGDFAGAKRRFLVIGNSYSASEIEMYKVLVEKERGAVTVTSSWGGSAVPEVQNRGTFDKANDYYWSSVVPALVGRLKAGDALLMINDGADFSPKRPDDESRQALENLHKGLSRIAEDTRKRGILVIYQSGNPFLRESSCTPDTAMPQWWNFRNEPPCKYYTRDDSLERRRAYQETLLDVQRVNNNFFVLDLFDVFCPKDVCRFYNEQGTFLYRDEYSHPSVEANMLARPLLLETVDKALQTVARRPTL